MKRSRKIGGTYGLTQEEMAGIMGIGRSHWSMFELGMRTLPAAAALLLAKVQSYMESPETKRKSTRLQWSGTEKSARTCSGCCVRMSMTRSCWHWKIAAIEKKQEAALRRAHLIDFVSTYKTENKITEGPPFIPPVQRTYIDPAQRGDTELSVEYELRKETLRFEQQLIESKLKEDEPPKLRSK